MIRYGHYLFVVVVLCTITSAASAALSDGVITVLTFNDESADDLTGRNDGIIRGGAEFAPGKNGLGLDVNGVDAYVEIPDDKSMDAMADEFTHAAWAFIRRSSDHGAILFKGEKIGWGPNFHIRMGTLNDTDLTYGSNNVKGAVDNKPERGAANPEGWFNVRGAYKLDTWIHMAQVGNGKTIQGFLNGKPAHVTDGFHGAAGRDPMALTAPYATFPGFPILVGVSRGRGDDVNNWEYIDGIIDDVVIFGRALSAVEIEKLSRLDLEALAVEPKDKLTTTWAEIKID